MTELRRIGLQEVERRLASLDDPDASGPGRSGLSPLTEPEATTSPDRIRLRRATVLATTFDPADLVVDGTELAPTDLSSFLSEDCQATRSESGWSWRLLPTVRTSTLQGLEPADRTLLLADEERDAPDADLPRRAAAMLLRGPVEVDRLDQPMLRALLIALDWLEPIEPNRSERAAILARLSLLEVQRPLRMLVGSYFVGRTSELKRIRRHLFGDTPPSGPLIVTGTGGVGKSTLIAKAVLDAWDGTEQLNATYFTFDRADLRADQPVTLLAEAARQIVASGDESARPTAERLADQARSTGIQYASERTSRANVSPSRSTTRSLREADLAKLTEEYASIAVRSGGPIVWILDTFEVAQRVGQEALYELARLLEVLADLIGPRWRVLISGRGTVEGFGGETMHLEGLDPVAARALLAHQLEGTGITAKVIESVVEHIGSNPLSVRLAGELLRREAQADGGGSTARLQRLVFRAEAGQIQGVLYRRILDRLPDHDLRKLANPGLVVRRIDPEVVRKVLAGPCGLGRLTKGESSDLVDRLGLEASLVVSVGERVLEHRADVRQLMLPLLERDNPAQVRAIHEAAVEFHAGRWRKTEDRADKIEELYHRLAIGQDEAVLAEVWDQEAAHALQPAVEELPIASQVYLADRLGWTVNPKLLEDAGDLAWASQAAQRARLLLDTGDAEAALELARERTGPTVRALIDPLIIESLAVLGRHAEAITQANQTLGWAAASAAWPTYIEVAVLGARIAEDAAAWTKARRLLRAARQAAEDTDDRILHLAAGVALLRVHRRSEAKDTKASRTLRADVLAEGRAMTETDRRANPTVVRDLAAEFGSEAPDLVEQATELVGVDLATSAGQAIITSLSSEDRQEFNRFARQESSPDTGPATEPPEDPDDEDLDWLSKGTSAEQSSVVSEFLKSDHKSEKWSDAISTSFRHDSDSQAF